jgi:hypothetical protein
MAKLQNRNTVMAVVKETTEGTPVAPSAATQFIPIHEGFTFDPAFDELENAELQSSIGKSKNTLGLENPTSSFDLYIKHSGVEAQAPNWGVLLESALGQVTAAPTELNVAASTTVSVVKVAASGTDYPRGSAVLLKNSSNAYEIRPVSGSTATDITLAFDSINIADTGVGIGRPVQYSPLSVGHPTLSVWGYRANAGALELMAGGRVSDLSIEVPAADAITGSFTIDGIQYYFNPLTTTASLKYVDITDDGGTVAAVVAEKTWKDPYELADALSTACTAASVGSGNNTITVTYDDSTGKFTFSSDGTTFSLLWNTGANTANTIGSLLGFSVAADDTGSTSYVGDNAVSWAAAFTPDFDDVDFNVAKGNNVLIGDQQDNVCFEAQNISYSIANTKADVLDMCSTSGKSGSQFTEREVTVDIVGYLTTNQAEEFKRFRANDEIAFAHNFGVKSGGNWVAGKCVNTYIPSARISSFTLGDSDGLVTVEMSIQAFVKNGQGEFYLNFL